MQHWRWFLPALHSRGERSDAFRQSRGQGCENGRSDVGEGTDLRRYGEVPAADDDAECGVARVTGAHVLDVAVITHDECQQIVTAFGQKAADERVVAPSRAGWAWQAPY